MQLRAPQTSEDFTRYYRLRYEVLRQPWNQPEGSEKASDDDQAIHVMAVADSDQVAGVCRMHMETPTEAQLRFMAVHPDFQGQGIGARLLQHLEKKAEEMGASEITFQARENAVAFYQRYGYEVVEKSHLLFGEIQHYKMIKRLNG